MLESQERGLQLLATLQGQEYRYRLENYTTSLSELTVRAVSPRSPGHCVRITFQTTIYLQLPTSWVQGDFTPATPEEKNRITRQLDLGELQAEQLLVLMARPPTGEIVVVCHQVFLSQEIPIA